MLHDEDDVVDHAHDREHELDRVDLNVFAVDGFEGHLEEGEEAASEVEEDISDAPALGGFSLPVPIHLGQVLQKRYRQLEVTHETHHRQSGLRYEGFSALR